MIRLTLLLVLLVAGAAACTPGRNYDVIIRGGTIYDGSGRPAFSGDLAINADTIAAVGDLADANARREIDATGLAVAPGFINMLSWATSSLIVDGRSQSDIRQGVTLEVFGEGWSEGPFTDAMRREQGKELADWMDSAEDAADVLGLDAGNSQDLAVPWTTLGEYLEFLETKGVAPNVASFVGATTVRIHVLGYDNREPTSQELERMQRLVQEAMGQGALGVGSSLIYAPAFYAKTDELIALCEAAAAYGGMYISHIRSEGNRLLESVDELITIAREAGVPAEIYHLKAAGQGNWAKLGAVIERVEAARAEGLAITADMYTYTAGSTGLDAAMPPSVQEGGFGEWRKRLQDPAIRRRLRREMTTPTDAWENLMLAAGPDNVLLVGFRNEELRPLIGKTLSEVAAMRGTSPAITAMDLVIEDSSRVDAVYFLMSEENVRRQIALPWISFDSDAGSLAPEGIFLNANPHPRAYGNFARLLGRYVRDEQIIPLEEAVRRLTSLPASNLKIERRGALKPGFFADIAIFDPASITDHATFQEPHQYATGMHHVFVNGEQVLDGGEHTGALPGRAVRGPGWAG